MVELGLFVLHRHEVRFGTVGNGRRMVRIDAFVILGHGVRYTISSTLNV